MEHTQMIRKLISVGLERKIIAKWSEEKILDKYNKLIDKENENNK